MRPSNTTTCQATATTASTCTRGGRTIADNDLSDNDGDGVAVMGGTVTIRRNTLDGNGKHGTYLGGDTVATVSGNHVHDNTKDGVSAHTGATVVVSENSIHGNGANGVSAGSGTVTVKSNIIVDNADDGVWAGNGSFTVTGNTIRGSGIGGIGLWQAEARIVDNTISGSQGSGMCIVGNSQATIVGNDVADSSWLGISVCDSTANITNAVVHDNAQAGIRLRYDSHAPISKCSLYDNGGLGIDLEGDGVTLNDADDSDTGPNDLLNFPEFGAVEVNGGSATLTGTAPPNSTVELFAAAPDATGYGEGKTWLRSVTADGDGNFAVEVDVSELPVTATATDAEGNTSEFSAYNLPPVAVALANDAETATVEQALLAGTPVLLDASRSIDPDGDDAQLGFAWDFDSDGEVDSTEAVAEATYTLGAHTATLTVTDPLGATATDTVTITVEDTTPPVVSLDAPQPSLLWPPNHKMIEGVVTGTVEEACDAQPEVDDVGAREPLKSGSRVHALRLAVARMQRGRHATCGHYEGPASGVRGRWGRRHLQTVAPSAEAAGATTRPDEVARR